MAETNKKRPKYNVLQCSGYMLRMAHTVCRSVIYIACGQVLAGVAVNLLELLVTPVILDAIERSAGVGQLIRLILLFSAGMIVAYAAQTYLRLNSMFGRVHVRVQIGSDIHQKLCRTSYPNTEDTAFLDRAERAANATDSNNSPAEAVWSTLVELLIHLICFAVYFALLTNVNGLILAVTMGTAVVGYFAGRYIRQWRYRHREEENACTHRLSYAFRRGRDRALCKDIRIFGLQPWLTDVCNSLMQLYQDFCNRSERMCLWADMADVVMALLRNGLAYGYLISMTVEGKLSAAEFLLYFSAVGGFTNWVTGILNDMTTVNKQSADISSVMEFLREKEQFQFEEGVPLPLQAGHSYQLELRDVTFRYPNAAEDTIRHLNLTIHPGEKLAIVGLNGAGKTTLIKLLCGFYDPTQGQVLLDGVDIRRYNRRDYYKLFSAVYQDFLVLAGTIAQNVAQSCSDSEIDMARVKACVAKAGLTEKIETLPQGYETLLRRDVYDDATELSGGQLQRLMLARALYKGGPVVVLDEPTAALDPIAENDIYQKYNEMTQGCTSVFISHRLVSTRFCDRIILLEQGEIIEEGTHGQLVAAGGAYARLFELQSRYYRAGGAEDGEE